jgi:hypothetical protein
MGYTCEVGVTFHLALEKVGGGVAHVVCSVADNAKVILCFIFDNNLVLLYEADVFL